jgi:four helix bundle protein
MATYKSFEEIQVWQKAREFANNVYRLTQAGPFARDFKLRDQINASAGAIMDNIAEGFERDGKREFIQFLSIAKGSAGEAKSQLYRALDRGYLSDEVFLPLRDDANEISKQLAGLMRYLDRSEYRGIKYAKEPEEGYGDGDDGGDS